MASPNNSKDTIPKGVAYAIIGTLVFLIIGAGVIAVIFLGTLQNNSPTASTTTAAVQNPQVQSPQDQSPQVQNPQDQSPQDQSPQDQSPPVTAPNGIQDNASEDAYETENNITPSANDTENINPFEQFGIPEFGVVARRFVNLEMYRYLPYGGLGSLLPVFTHEYSEVYLLTANMPSILEQARDRDAVEALHLYHQALIAAGFTGGIRNEAEAERVVALGSIVEYYKVTDDGDRITLTINLSRRRTPTIALDISVSFRVETVENLDARVDATLNRLSNHIELSEFRGPNSDNRRIAVDVTNISDSNIDVYLRVELISNGSPVAWTILVPRTVRDSGLHVGERMEFSGVFTTIPLPSFDEIIISSDSQVRELRTW